MSLFLEHLSMWNMLHCAEQVQIQKYKTRAYNLWHPKQQVSKQSCRNIQLSSKKKKQQQKVPIKPKSSINLHINNPNHTN